MSYVPPPDTRHKRKVVTGVAPPSRGAAPALQPGGYVWALAKVRAGHTARRVSWHGTGKRYIAVRNRTVFIRRDGEGYGRPLHYDAAYRPTPADVLAVDWIITC